MAVLISSVAVRQDIANELGGDEAIENLTTTGFRLDDVLALALADVLYELKNRTPPVPESAIAFPLELKRAVVEATIARLYLNCITTPDGLNATKYRMYDRKYQSTISSLRPTVSGGLLIGAPFSIAMQRR